jgi:hypothetical protein
MHRYGLRAAEALIAFDDDAAGKLLRALVQSADCPAEIQRQAARALRDLSVQEETDTHSYFLARIDAALL